MLGSKPGSSGGQVGAGSFSRPMSATKTKRTKRTKTKLESSKVDNFVDHRKPNYRSGAGAGGGEEGCQGASCERPKPLGPVLPKRPTSGGRGRGGGGGPGGGGGGDDYGDGGGPMANYFRAVRSPFKVVTGKGKKKRRM